MEWCMQGEKYVMPHACLKAIQDGESPAKVRRVFELLNAAQVRAVIMCRFF